MVLGSTHLLASETDGFCHVVPVAVTQSESPLGTGVASKYCSDSYIHLDEM